MSSGQPYKYASDPAKFRTAFMNTLQEQININDMNLQANKIYKETGQLPPQSQMKDTRTTAEILADREKLKLSLIQDFKAVGTPGFIMSIIQGVTDSPLNGDGSLFTFMAQRAPEIATVLKKQYRYGIKEDLNDTAKFVSFIEDMYTKTKSFSSTVSQYFSRTGGVNPSTGIIKVGDINRIIEIYNEMKKQFSLKLKPGDRGPITTKLTEITQILDTISKLLNQENDMKLLEQFFETRFDSSNDLFNDPDLGMNIYIDDFLTIYKDYYDVLTKLPKAETLYALLEQLERSIKNSSDSLSLSILDNIIEMLPDIGEMVKIYNDASEISGQWEALKETRTQANRDRREQYQILNDPNFDPFNSDDDEPVEEIPDVRDQGEAQQIQDEIKRLDAQQKALKARPDFYTTPGLIEESKRISDEMRELLQGPIKGKGVKKQRGRPKGRAKGSGVKIPYSEVVKSHTAYDQGIQESPRFVKFGRYLVNQKMLGDGIFSVKSNGGYRIPEIPSTRLSKPLQGIIKKMISGGSLTYDELNTLSEPEKVFLHKVSKKSNIIDKFNIPTPSMDKKEKDIHEFEVMKGEILAGNDSKELIKKFKTHIIRLSREEVLPKKEVSEIMEILLELGL